jgi:hypothetical protein
MTDTSAISNSSTNPITTTTTTPFTQRLINVTFILGNGTFQNSNLTSTPNSGPSNSITLSGLRVSTRITNVGGYVRGGLEMEIYGMPLSIMNQLSTLGLAIQLLARNQVIVTAGTAATGMGIVFIGDILNAWLDGAPAPDVPFRVVAQVLAAASVIPASVLSYTGSADVATILSGLAIAANLRFENNGVQVSLNNPYLPGNVQQQIQKVVSDAGIQSNNGEGGVLSIWPKNGSRNGLIPLITAGQNMIGYPIYTSTGIMLRALFSPNLGLGPVGSPDNSTGNTNGGAPQMGGLIKVENSILPQANRTWKVYGLDYQLDSLFPNGQWATTIRAYDLNDPQPAV